MTEVYYGEDLYLDDQIPFYLSFEEVKKLNQWERKMWLKCTLVPFDEKNGGDYAKGEVQHVNMERRLFLLAWGGSPPSAQMQNETIVHVPNDPIRTFMNKDKNYEEIRKNFIST